MVVALRHETFLFLSREENFLTNINLARKANNDFYETPEPSEKKSVLEAGPERRLFFRWKH